MKMISIVLTNGKVIMHATINVACKALKDSCDAAIETIESEMEK